jgi:hypothetical protein
LIAALCGVLKCGFVVVHVWFTYFATIDANVDNTGEAGGFDRAQFEEDQGQANQGKPPS